MYHWASHLRIARIAVVSLVLSAGLAFAQTVVSFDRAGPKPGNEFVYDSGKGRTVKLTFKAPGQYAKADGSLVRKDRDGNTLQNGPRSFVPHSGYRPTGVSGNLKVGHTWVHQYESEGIVRTRKCNIESKKDVTTKAGTFPGAYKVVCESQRHDRSLPRYEEIWFAENLDIEVKYSAKWYGSSPGSMGYELSEVRLSP